ncbi:MAG: hypothetical protein NT062_17900 [Proteobacteria bacterium]|nr:hypothetical protein [Pseudomonadota bacterium]
MSEAPVPTVSEVVVEPFSDVHLVGRTVIATLRHATTVGGTIYDADGQVLKTYEGQLPQVLTFDVPEGCKAFTLEVGGQRFTRTLIEAPPDEAHAGDHDDDATVLEKPSKRHDHQ